MIVPRISELQLNWRLSSWFGRLIKFKNTRLSGSWWKKVAAGQMLQHEAIPNLLALTTALEAAAQQKSSYLLLTHKIADNLLPDGINKVNGMVVVHG